MLNLKNGISKNTASLITGRKEVKQVRQIPKYISCIALGSIIASILFVQAPALPSENESPSVAESDSETRSIRFDSTLTPIPEPVEINDSSNESKYYDIPLSAELQDYTRSVCETYKVPYELVISIISVESSFRTDIVSGTSDYGLMQINKCNHEQLSRELGITDILDPEQNILAGVYIFSAHLDAMDGDFVLALMRYNCGAAGAKRLWGQGIYTTSYTDKVMAAYETYKK